MGIYFCNSRKTKGLYLTDSLHLRLKALFRYGITKRMLVLYSIMVKSLWQIGNLDLSCQNADIVQFIFQDAQVFGSKAYPFNTATIYQLVTATTMQLLRQYFRNTALADKSSPGF